MILILKYMYFRGVIPSKMHFLFIQYVGYLMLDESSEPLLTQHGKHNMVIFLKKTAIQSIETFTICNSKNIVCDLTHL